MAEAGISVDVPKTWTGDAVPPRKVKAWLRSVRRTDPGFGQWIGELVGSGALARTRFVARDPANGDTLRVSLYPGLVAADAPSVEDIRADAANPDSDWVASGYSLLSTTDAFVGRYSAVRTLRTMQPAHREAGNGYLHAELDIFLGAAGVVVTLVVDDTPAMREIVDRILSNVQPL